MVTLTIFWFPKCLDTMLEYLIIWLEWQLLAVPRMGWHCRKDTQTATIRLDIVRHNNLKGGQFLDYPKGLKRIVTQCAFPYTLYCTQMFSTFQTRVEYIIFSTVGMDGMESALRLHIALRCRCCRNAIIFWRKRLFRILWNTWEKQNTFSSLKHETWAPMQNSLIRAEIIDRLVKNNVSCPSFPV